MNPPLSRNQFTSSRREFLTRSALGGAALALAGPLSSRSGAAAAPVPWTMRLSTSSIHFHKLPIEQACERVAALGFEGIDIWSAYQGCPHLDDVVKRLGGAGLKELLAKTKLKLFAFSVYVGGFARYAELLGQAGGGVAVRGSEGPCPPADLTPRMRAFLEKLKPEIELAAKHHSKLAIENHGHALLDSLDSLKAFTDLNTSPHVGIALAPYHLQAIKAPVEEAIRISGPQLLFFYAWQNGSGFHQLPGHGPTDFTPWLSALAQARYDGYVNPFMHGEEPAEVMAPALAKARDYLKQRYAQAAGKQ
jgi:sugar phosphate isomerase/epimerase